MNEKMLSVKLPKGAKYQRVIVTEGSDEVQIVYSTEELIAKRNEIPKPEPLIGGKDVYQEYDVPYWYCKIKGGRDTFMHLYMKDLTYKDLLYDAEGRRRVFNTYREWLFRENCMEALKHKPKEGFRWLPVYEVTRVSLYNLELQVTRTDGNEAVLEFPEFPVQEWERRLKSYSPENESGMCSKNTYFLLLLRWLKDGIATLEELADDSTKLGNYANNLTGHGFRERTGERRFGGLYSFVGNTGKIVKSANGYLYMGGSCIMDGNVNPVSQMMILVDSRDFAPKG